MSERNLVKVGVVNRDWSYLDKICLGSSCLSRSNPGGKCPWWELSRRELSMVGVVRVGDFDGGSRSGGSF